MGEQALYDLGTAPAGAPGPVGQPINVFIDFAGFIGSADEGGDPVEKVIEFMGQHVL